MIKRLLLLIIILVVLYVGYRFLIAPSTATGFLGHLSFSERTGPSDPERDISSLSSLELLVKKLESTLTSEMTQVQKTEALTTLQHLQQMFDKRREKNISLTTTQRAQIEQLVERLQKLKSSILRLQN